MEYYYYVVLLFIALIFGVKRTLVRSKVIFFVIYIILAMGMILTVRTSGFDVDIVTYASAMESQSLSYYYMKEPLVWFGQRFLYGYFQDALTVFIITDTILIFLLYLALRNIGVPQYAYLSILLFFPFFFGFQNVYRQLYSGVLFLLAISILYKNKSIVLSYGSYLLSAASHHVSLAFIVSLFLKFNYIFLLTILVMVVFGVYWFSGTKSSAETGLDFRLLYFLVSVSIFFTILISKSHFYNKLVLLGFLVTLASFFIFDESQSERVAMFYFLSLYPFLAVLLDDVIKQKFAARFLFIMSSSMPIFIFPSALFFI